MKRSGPDVKNKYNELKRAEVVKSEIENYERLWIQNFLEDEKQCDGLFGIARSREICRQKWYHILITSTDLCVIFLRTLILLNELDDKYFSLFKGDNYKSIKKLSGYSKYKELNRLKIEHLKTKYPKDPFIEALKNYLCNQVKPSDVCFSTWYKAQFEYFAKNVSEIYSYISDVIHNARFTDDDENPQEYTILRKPEYDRCINYLMSFYSNSSLVTN